MHTQLGLWGLFSIVIGSQIGTGIFMLPNELSSLGWYAFVGWILSGLGALALTMVFIHLVERFPKTGGPHVFAQQAFGPDVGFFTGWTYWVISCLSSATVVLAVLSYLTPIIGELAPWTAVGFEIWILAAILLINLLGVANAGGVEFMLAMIKILILIVIPITALFYFDPSNISLGTSEIDVSPLQLIERGTFLTLWAFIGLETATTPAESVINPRFTIPAAMLLGTGCVLVLYLLNSLALQGLMPEPTLHASAAPYVDAADVLFGGDWSSAIGLFAALVCVSNLNAWCLTAGQIALGLAQDGILPDFFKTTNSSGAPTWALTVSQAMLIPLILCTMDNSLNQQIVYIIKISVMAFLYVYLTCSVGLFYLLIRENQAWYHSGYVFSVCAIAFCSYLIIGTALSHLDEVITALFFVVSGLPVYWFHFRKRSLPQNVA